MKQENIKLRKLLLSLLLVLCLVFSMTACGTNSAEQQDADNADEAAVDMPDDPNINPDTAQYWAEILGKYRFDDNVNQLLLVRYTGGCSAVAQYFVKSDYNSAWELEFESIADVGKHGIDKTKEGDAKAPTMDLGIVTAFGLLPNPGTAFDYIDIKETTYACDEDCEYYNQIIDIEETGHECTGEAMYDYSPQYNYGLATDYNSKNVYPNGSAIFIHVKGVKGYTGGCIALDQDDMETILKTAEPGMRVVIGQK